MAKKTTKKAYETKVSDGRIEIKLIVPTTDGKAHTASAPNPFVCQVEDADGKMVMKQLTKKQTEAFLFDQIKQYIKVA
jgi:hypothetical protein